MAPGGWDMMVGDMAGRIDDGHTFEQCYLGFFQLINAVGKISLTYGREFVDRDSTLGEENSEETRPHSSRVKVQPQ